MRNTKRPILKILEITLYMVIFVTAFAAIGSDAGSILMNTVLSAAIVTGIYLLDTTLSKPRTGPISKN